MNFNQWYIFHFVQWTFAIFLVSSWFHAHRTSGLYGQKTEPSAISQLHYHWKFYHSRSSAKIKINNNRMVQGQGYIVDVTSLPNQALIIFGELLKMCVVWRCHGEKLHLYVSPILAVFLWQLRAICSADDSRHSNKLFGSLEAAQKIQKRIEFIAFKMQITSVDPNIKFFNESMTFYMTGNCWFWYF